VANLLDGNPDDSADELGDAEDWNGSLHECQRGLVNAIGNQEERRAWSMG
jgi:hypothetical protein